MIQLAINILWLLIGIVVLLGVVWLALYVVKMFVPLPGQIENAIWAVVLILCLIGVLTLLAGGGGNLRAPRFGDMVPPFLAAGAVAGIPASTATYLR